jgi:hypothetical protein
VHRIELAIPEDECQHQDGPSGGPDAEEREQTHTLAGAIASLQLGIEALATGNRALHSKYRH